MNFETFLVIVLAIITAPMAIYIVGTMVNWVMKHTIMRWMK
jgi:hypothetical protein